MTEEQLKRMKMVIDEKVNPICVGLGNREEHDEYGVYSTGVFASSKTSTTIVGCSEEGFWRMTIKSKNPLGLMQIKAYKRTFIPNKVVMAYLFGSREDGSAENIYHLVQINGG